MENKRLYLITVAGQQKLGRYLESAGSQKQPGFAVYGGIVYQADVTDIQEIPDADQEKYYDTSFNSLLGVVS